MSEQSTETQQEIDTSGGALDLSGIEPDPVAVAASGHDTSNAGDDE